MSRPSPTSPRGWRPSNPAAPSATRCGEAQQLGAIATLLAGVAHGLNNPLSVVAAQATLLAEEATGTPLAERAEKVSLAARRCGRIVASMLASARRRPPQRIPVDLRAVVGNAKELLAHRLQASTVEVTVRLPKRQPRLLADPDQLVHLLANLLGNAVAVLRDRPRRAASPSPAAAAGMLELRVADNGPGIPEELRQRVFDPFFTTRPAGSGTGIGLALCRTIAHDHAGTIEAEETPAAARRWWCGCRSPLRPRHGGRRMTDPTALAGRHVPLRR